MYITSYNVKIKQRQTFLHFYYMSNQGFLFHRQICHYLNSYRFRLFKHTNTFVSFDFMSEQNRFNVIFFQTNF